MSESELRTANHWWWRPDWEVGRRFYTWHLTFDDTPAVHRLACAWRAELEPFLCLDLIPDRWLHLTMQGLGFVDEVDISDVEAIVDAATKRLALIPSFELELDRPGFTPEAIRWEAQPGEPVAAVRSAIREAIGEVWTDVPEPADGFGPHVSIGYANDTADAKPILEVLAATPSARAVARISSAELIILGRDSHMYEWETFASVPLGS